VLPKSTSVVCRIKAMATPSIALSHHICYYNISESTCRKKLLRKTAWFFNEMTWSLGKKKVYAKRMSNILKRMSNLYYIESFMFKKDSMTGDMNG